MVLEGGGKSQEVPELEGVSHWGMVFQTSSCISFLSDSWPAHSEDFYISHAPAALTFPSETGAN